MLAALKKWPDVAVDLIVFLASIARQFPRLAFYGPTRPLGQGSSLRQSARVAGSMAAAYYLPERAAMIWNGLSFPTLQQESR